jgi:hypothetical protein
MRRGRQSDPRRHNDRERRQVRPDRDRGAVAMPLASGRPATASTRTSVHAAVTGTSLIAFIS